MVTETHPATIAGRCCRGTAMLAFVAFQTASAVTRTGPFPVPACSYSQRVNNIWDSFCMPEMMLSIPDLKDHEHLQVLFPGLPRPDSGVTVGAGINGVSVSDMSALVQWPLCGTVGGARVHGVTVTEFEENVAYRDTSGHDAYDDMSVDQEYGGSLDLWLRMRNSSLPFRGVSACGDFVSERTERTHLWYSDTSLSAITRSIEQSADETTMSGALRFGARFKQRYWLFLYLARTRESDSSVTSRRYGNYDSDGVWTLGPAHIYVYYAPSTSTHGELSFCPQIRGGRTMIGGIGATQSTRWQYRWDGQEGDLYEQVRKGEPVSVSKTNSLYLFERYSTVRSRGRFALHLGQDMTAYFTRESLMPAELTTDELGISVNGSMLLRYSSRSLTLLSGVNGGMGVRRTYYENDEQMIVLSTGTSTPTSVAISYSATPVAFIWKALANTRIAFFPAFDESGAWLWKVALHQRFATASRRK